MQRNCVLNWIWYWKSSKFSIFKISLKKLRMVKQTEIQIFKEVWCIKAVTLLFSNYITYLHYLNGNFYYVPKSQPISWPCKLIEIFIVWICEKGSSCVVSTPKKSLPNNQEDCKPPPCNLFIYPISLLYPPLHNCMKEKRKRWLKLFSTRFQKLFWP